MSDEGHRGIWARGVKERCTIFTVLLYIYNYSEYVYLKIIYNT